MADISNLKINERSHVERPNLRENTAIENEKWEDKVSKFIYIKEEKIRIFGILIIFQIP